MIPSYTRHWYSSACLEGHPVGHNKIVVSEDRWSLLKSSITLKCWTFCQEYVSLAALQLDSKQWVTTVIVDCPQWPLP